MFEFNGSWLGYLESGCIAVDLEALQYALTDCPAALISSIDSARGAQLAGFLDAHVFQDVAATVGSKCVFCDAGVLLSTATAIALTATEHNIFNGWDEAWLFRSWPDPALTEPPSLASGRSMTEDPHADWLRPVTDWRARYDAVLGLGDGHGLNYVAETPTVAREVEAAAATGRNRH